ncbi:MAG: excinuclease ABC subunit A [Ottowia sp.]|nr:excinuclease ABC subunit A [Ottowia sp.]
MLLTSLFFITPARARDTQEMHSLEKALNTAEAKNKLNPHIQLYFGNQSRSQIAKKISEIKTNKKTNGFNKSDVKACQRAFLSAVLELQKQATQDGGDAVINILSNYRNKEISSDTEYMCGSGALMSGVALKGTVVKLAQ